MLWRACPAGSEGLSSCPELPENWTDTRETLLEGMLFTLKYLGMTLVEQPKGEELSAAAVKRIVATVSPSQDGAGVGSVQQDRLLPRVPLVPCLLPLLGVSEPPLLGVPCIQLRDSGRGGRWACRLRVTVLSSCCIHGLSQPLLF